MIPNVFASITIKLFMTTKCAFELKHFIQHLIDSNTVTIEGVNDNIMIPNTIFGFDYKKIIELACRYQIEHKRTLC